MKQRKGGRYGRIMAAFLAGMLMISGCGNAESTATTAAPSTAAQQTTQAVTLAPTAAAETQAAQVTEDRKGKLVIVHTNDIHGRYLHSDENKNLGLPDVMALVNYYKAQNAEVLLVDAGDFSQGTTLARYYKGANSGKYLAAAGYEYASIGNHEFDYGFEELLAITDELQNGGVKILDANIKKKDGGGLLYGDSAIIERNGMKIGIFGIDTPEAYTKTTPSHVASLVFDADEDLYRTAQQEVDKLKAENCDFIICLGHVGTDPNSEPSASYDVLNHVNGIDLFIDGHSHTEIDGGEIYNEGLLVSTGSYMANIGVVEVNPDKTMKAYLISYDTFMSDYAVGDWEKNYCGEKVQALQKMIEDDAKVVQEAYSAVVGKTDFQIFGEVRGETKKDDGGKLIDVVWGGRNSENTAGDMITDGMLWYAQEISKDLKDDQGNPITVSAATIQGGCIRCDLGPGDITINDLITIQPNASSIMILVLTGEQLLEAFEAAYQSCPDSLGAFAQLSDGFEITLDTTVPYEAGEQYPSSTYYAPAKDALGKRVQVKIGGEDLDLVKVYYIATSSFLAEGGATYNVFTHCVYSYDSGKLDFEVLQKYIQEGMGGVVDQKYAKVQNRIHMISDWEG